MGTTLQDIADHLQISKSSVSRALRHDPLIHPKTRAKVRATALQLGYEGQPRGTRHKGEKAQKAPQAEQPTIGLLFHASSLAAAQQDLNLVQTMEGVMCEAEQSGMMLLVHAIRVGKKRLMEDDPTEVPPMIRSRACQAVIVRGMLNPHDVAFLSRHLPVVSIGRIYPELPVDAVVADDVDGTRELTTRLARLGHRRLTWVDAHYGATFFDARQAGFLHGCVRNGLDLGQLRFLGPEIYEDGRIHAQEKLLEAVRAGTTAMVCGNDSIALQVIEALENAGVRVPQDVSVTGFDALQATAGGRRVTSVDPHFSQMGCVAVRLAAERSTQSPGMPRKVSVRAEIVDGDTIAPPPSEASEL